MSFAAVFLEKFPDKKNALPTLQELADYLWTWNQRFRLVGAKNRQTLESHFIDAVYFAAALPEFSEMIYIGAGAGIHGFVINSIWPNKEILLLEPREKACAFLEEAASRFNFKSVKVIAKQISEFKDWKNVDVDQAIGIARAFSPLAKLPLLIKRSFPPGFRVFLAGTSATQAKLEGVAAKKLQIVSSMNYYPNQESKRVIQVILIV